MDTQKIMLGNYIKRDDLIREVIAIADGEIATEDNEGFFSSDQYEPIELTPYVLEACGYFPDTRDGGVWFQEKGYLSGYGVFIDKEQITFYKYNRFGVDTLIVDDRHFQHLHHFQNLIQSLTGSPLNVDAAKIK